MFRRDPMNFLNLDQLLHTSQGIYHTALVCTYLQHTHTWLSLNFKNLCMCIPSYVYRAHGFNWNKWHQTYLITFTHFNWFRHMVFFILKYNFGNVLFHFQFCLDFWVGIIYFAEYSLPHILHFFFWQMSSQHSITFLSRFFFKHFLTHRYTYD